MTYLVHVAPAAQRQLRTCDPQVRRRIQAAIELLASDPRPPKAIQLVGGAGEWRVRTGDYRPVYEIQNDRLIVLVLTVGHRREIYKARYRNLQPAELPS
jgi:mRNA interferase RelE/StbE